MLVVALFPPNPFAFKKNASKSDVSISSFSIQKFKLLVITSSASLGVEISPGIIPRSKIPKEHASWSPPAGPIVWPK